MNKLLFAPLLLVSLLFAACGEKERAFPEFGDDDVLTGAYARLTDGVNGVYDFFKPSESNIDFTVEFYDVSEGRDVTTYEWTAAYVDNAKKKTSDRVEVLSVPSSSFTENDFGLPATTIRFNFKETLDKLGKSIDSIKAGDQIRYESTITLKDGRKFTRFNTGSNVISGTSFRATFLVDQTIVCPSDIGGTFDVVTTTPASWPDSTNCKASEWKGQVTWTKASEGVYKSSDFTNGAYSACYSGLETGAPDNPQLPAGTLQIQDACNVLSAIGASEVGVKYTFDSVTVDGKQLTIDWKNSKGESAITVFTRTDDKNWPPLTK